MSGRSRAWRRAGVALVCALLVGPGIPAQRQQPAAKPVVAPGSALASAAVPQPPAPAVTTGAPAPPASAGVPATGTTAPSPAATASYLPSTVFGSPAAAISTGAPATPLPPVLPAPATAPPLGPELPAPAATAGAPAAATTAAPPAAASTGYLPATTFGSPAVAVSTGAAASTPEAATTFATRPSAPAPVVTPNPASSVAAPATAASSSRPATVAVPAAGSSGAEAAAAATVGPAPSLDDIEHRTFEYFWQTANPANGLIPDHWPLGDYRFASIAAVGFALTAYPIGVEHGWITRAQAVQRVLTTLKFFADAPQGDSEDDDAGYHGFFYHFLDMRTGLRYARWVEVSTVDTTWLMAGVLFDETYFDRDDPQEEEIRRLAEKLYEGVDWPWAQRGKPLLSMGWTPGGKFIPYEWKGYDEAMMLYILALGSPSHAIKPDAWKAWTSTYKDTWGSFMGGKPHVGFAPLFGHQYTQSWIDMRGIQDAFMRARGMTYFENSRRSVIGQREYAINIGTGNRATGYGPDIWGLTACDGPGDTTWEHADGSTTIFHGYFARGADVGDIIDDGTIAPTAAISSIVFAPDLVLPTIDAMYDRYGRWLYSRYGFLDAFNPSFQLDVPLRTGHVVPGEGWFDDRYLGIDQGPILLMIENYRSGFVWSVMRRNPHVREGLERAGFKGGWLAKSVPRRTAARAAAAAAPVRIDVAPAVPATVAPAPPTGAPAVPRVRPPAVRRAVPASASSSRGA